MSEIYGYRNIYYDPKKKIVRTWMWDNKGNRIEKQDPFKPYIFVESKQHKDAVSIFNTPLRKLEFPSSFDRRRYINESGIKRVFYNLKPYQQYAIDTFGGMQNGPDYGKFNLKTFFLDIETFSPHSFPIPTVAAHPINLITVYDTLNKMYHTFGLSKDYVSKNTNSIYYKCIDEEDLFEQFLTFWENDYPDVISGWNSEFFDIPYIINRINNVLGDNAAKRLSPVGSLLYQEDVKQQFGKDLGRWYIHGISCVDYMEAYKTFSRDKRESYALNYISNVELGEGKTQINATSLAKLSEQNWELFVDYNIQDVALLVKLEEKLRFLKIMRMIAYKGFTTLEATMGKISVVTGAIAQQARERNKIIPTFVKEDMGTYGGGFVKDVIPGLTEYVVTFDANSLYPNTLISLNLSDETKIGKIVNIDKDSKIVELLLTNGKTHKLDEDKFVQYMHMEKIAISKAKILYSQKEKGIIPEYVDSLYTERKTAKKEMLELDQENVNLHKNTAKYKENKRRSEQLDILQYTLKILLNSIYGVFGNKHSPFYDVDHAASITNTGQSVIKAASRIADEYIKKTYGTTKDSYVYSDTDSTHLTLKPLLEQCNIQFLDADGRIAPDVYLKVNELQQVINNGIAEWSKTTLNSLDPRFYFKREAICPSAIYQAKKHYLLHIKDKGEDKPLHCDYIKYVGIEVVKSTMSDPVKKLIKRVIENIVYKKDKHLATEEYKQVYEEFKTLSLADLSFRSSINNYGKYLQKSSGFIAGKRTPVHVKAAIHYNLLLKEFKIDTTYDTIDSGQKIKWLYVEPSNKYNISCIGFINNYPTEFANIIKPDYEMMFEKLITPAISRFFDCLNWRMIDIKNQVTCDLLDLFGV
jgi:DNA polymerase elongation subunit (family B)